MIDGSNPPNWVMWQVSHRLRRFQASLVQDSFHQQYHWDVITSFVYGYVNISPRCPFSWSSELRFVTRKRDGLCVCR